MKYIGARYMPKFMGAYDATQSYEALSVVDNGLGTSYVSNKPTPAGTPLTDTEYWAVYGASSGAILDLQSRMSTAESDINEINTEAGFNRKVVCIGDSYLGGSGPVYQETKSWGAKLRWLLNNGDDTILNGHGGSGFIGQPDAPTYIELLTEVVNNLTASERGEISDVVVQGGLNDKYGLNHGTYDKGDIMDAITAFVGYAHTNFPNATIRIGVAGWATDGLSDKANWAAILDCFEWAASSNAANKVQYMAGLERIMPKIYDSEYYDTTHPDENASTLIARGIFNCMLGGYGDAGNNYTNADVDITWETGITQIAKSISFDVYGDMVTLKFTALYFEFDTATHYTFTTPIQIADITGGQPIRASLGVKIPCYLWASDGNGGSTTMSGFIIIKNKHISIEIASPLAGCDLKQVWVRCADYNGSIFEVC